MSLGLLELVGATIAAGIPGITKAMTRAIPRGLTATLLAVRAALARAASYRD